MRFDCLLDGAPYFWASSVTDLTARDDLALVRVPACSSELNSVEECWRQLKDALGNRSFDSLDELNAAIDDALSRISVPDVSNYFC